MRSLYAPKEFLSKEECKALFDQVTGLASGGGRTLVWIVSQWNGSARWARNRMHIASDVRNINISITRNIRGAAASVTTSRTDTEGLRQAVRDAETLLRIGGESPENIDDPYIDEPMLSPVLWSDPTYSLGADRRTEIVQTMIDGAEQAGLLSAGQLQISASGTATFSSEGVVRYYPQTAVECSLTVRDPKGTGSGWAGVNHYALEKIDPMAIAATALDKCQRSVSPSAVEPGRYTAVLEPQAVADLWEAIMQQPIDRQFAEMPAGPFGGKRPGTSKITEQVLDRRLMLRADPMEPEGGFLPFEPWSGTPYQAVNWIDKGILRELAYSRWYALPVLNLDRSLPNSSSYKLTAAPGVPTTTIEDMIARTKRGVYVTRFSGINVVDMSSMLSNGYTRDGLWLIEDGKITRPIKNFRITESPMFVLNNLDDISEPRRVFAPGRACMAPAVRVRDFSFTSLADAV